MSKYNITKDEADMIVSVIRSFACEMYNQKLNGTLLGVKKDFPISAMEYNRERKK